MKEPYDFNRAFPPEPPTTAQFVKYIFDEKKKVREPVDERIKVLEEEFHRLVIECNKADEIFLNTVGFWKRRAAKKEMKRVHSQMAIVRDLVYKLYNVRA